MFFLHKIVFIIVN